MTGDFVSLSTADAGNAASPDVKIEENLIWNTDTNTCFKVTITHTDGGVGLPTLTFQDPFHCCDAGELAPDDDSLLVACAEKTRLVWEEDSSTCILQSFKINSLDAMIESTLMKIGTRSTTECCKEGARDNDGDLLEACEEKYEY